MKKFFKALVLFLILLISLSTGTVVGAICGMVKSAEELAADALNLSMDLTTIIYAESDTEGQYQEIEGLYDDENRIWVSIDQIPANLQNAFVAIEDERFYKHHGVDLKRTIRATFNYLAHDQDSSYGGSTITQQLVKNITGEKEDTPKRKIQEMYRAFVLERKLSKTEILELYLNTIYLSERCNGVQTAAKLYFDKDVSELTLPECVAIAGITQFPTKYDPILNPENNKEKSRLILNKMVELGMISDAQREDAINTPLALNPNYEEVRAGTQSYFVDALIDDVLKDLQKVGYSEAAAKKMLYSGGLQIYSTVDLEVQAIMEDVYKDDSNFPAGRDGLEIESAMVVMDPYTGEVKGLVGGRGEKTENRVLNRATQTVRQPGSTIKPIGVYGPALEYGVINLNSSILDAPLEVNGWKPKNSYKGYRGLVSVKSAVASSMNIPAVRVLQQLGVENSFRFMTENLHISSLVESREVNGKVYSDKGLASLALGGLTDGISVLEMTAAYAPFVNSGVYSAPHLYTKVYDRNGKLLLERNGTKNVAMSEYAASAMTKLLQGVVSGGTGSRANFGNMAIAGKTGTTSEDKDRWFVGYTPYYVSAAWVGFDSPKSLRYISGTNPALLVWRAVNERLHENLEKRDFPAYDGKNSSDKNSVKVTVCSVSGKLANEYCGSCKVSQTFAEGAAPTERCNVHNAHNRGSAIKVIKKEIEESDTEVTDSNEGATGNMEDPGPDPSNGTATTPGTSPGTSSGTSSTPGNAAPSNSQTSPADSPSTGTEEN